MNRNQDRCNHDCVCSQVCHVWKFWELANNAKCDVMQQHEANSQQLCAVCNFCCTMKENVTHPLPWTSRMHTLPLWICSLDNSKTEHALQCLEKDMHGASSDGTHSFVIHSRKLRSSACGTSCPQPGFFTSSEEGCSGQCPRPSTYAE